MARFPSRRSPKAGLPPGTLVHVGAVRAEEVKVTLIRYDAAQISEQTLDVTQCVAAAPPAVTWVNVDGLHQVEVIEALGRCFGIHPLVLEDVLHTGQRPKFEDYGEYVFLVLRMLYRRGDGGPLEDEQVSLVIGPNWVLSFQEREGDVFDPVRERIRSGKGRIRTQGADYLAYSLLDAVVDHYFTVLEGLGDEVEELGERILTRPDPHVLSGLHSLKQTLLFTRKAVWPLREVLSRLQRGESPLFGRETQLYMRDAYDHTIQVMDTVETFRDMIAGMLEVYLSSVSNRMNEIMKVLTVIATIFMPLTFIAGVYGMNFLNMPELRWRYGYFAALGVMFVVAVGMLVYFRRKKWF
ncbi:MAG: magnesium/cobalt transporter CorA [Candidatus Bipolaricaulota bacterium]